MKLNYFSFKELNNKMLLTNDFGEYIFLEKDDFKRLISKDIEANSEFGRELLDKHIIYDESDLLFSQKSEYKLRGCKGHLAIATSLHIFVVTTACNLNCRYCQANNGTQTPNCFMSIETAEKAVDMALQSPEVNLSFEFQGGEPLLNYPVIKHIIEYTEEHNNGHNIVFSVVSNLTLLTEEMIEFFKNKNVSVSTSLDGNELVHNTNRPYKSGEGSFADVIKKIKLLKERGLSVGAIETTTAFSLPYAREIVDAYVNAGLDSIFIRNLTMLGKAQKNWDKIGYTAQEYLEFYKQILNVILDYNINGITLKEQHASILLKRMNGNSLNYMELRSPCGAGIGQVAYFADGRIFTCDEGRMLAEMGNDAFLLGNVYRDDYCSIIKSRVCHAACSSSILESIPSCCDCVYQPYCGVCPVVNYANGDDLIEKNPRGFRCSIYSGMLDLLFGLYQENNEDVVSVLNSWS